MATGRIDDAVLTSVRNISRKVTDACSGHLDVENQIKDAIAAGPIELARAYVVLREAMETMEESLKPFQALFQRVKNVEMPQAFQTAGVPTINLEEGFRVSVVQQTRASIRPGMKEEAHRYLQNNGYGDVIQETINSATLSSLARTLQEENLELDETIFNVAIMPTTSVTKTAK